MRVLHWLAVVLLAVSMSSSDDRTTRDPGGQSVARPGATRRVTPNATFDPWLLWSGTTHLRGANIYQRRVYPELDGDEFMGSGPVGPPFVQADFDRLAALGANYVNISHPGLFGEDPPWVLDEMVQDNLDALLEMAAESDLFVVIAFRTGPGRSEFTFHLEDVGTWFDESFLNDDVWIDQAAQDAWVAMWGHVASRYAVNPVVVGYDLMVEPNSNEVWLDEWDPDAFYDEFAGTLYDWNQLFPEITTAIRGVDPTTPVLVGGMAYSSVEWLPYVIPSGDARTIYVVHQYAPVVYTHQESPAVNSYPGVFDTDWDGEDDNFNIAWLQNLLTTVADFASVHSVPVAANEFGVMRWVPGAAGFMTDQIYLLEGLNTNHALWAWEPIWPPWNEEVDAFNFLHGPAPENHSDVTTSDLIDAVTTAWERNSVRPSTVGVAP